MNGKSGRQGYGRKSGKQGKLIDWKENTDLSKTAGSEKDIVRKEDDRV